MNWLPEQEDFIRLNYENKTTRWIANQLGLNHSTVVSKIERIKNGQKQNQANKLTAMIKKLSEMQNELIHLKGAEWDSKVREINNLSVDIELKRRQNAFRNSSAHFGDEMQIYKLNNI